MAIRWQLFPRYRVAPPDLVGLVGAFEAVAVEIESPKMQLKSNQELSIVRPHLEGLEITAKTAGNAIIEDALFEVRRSIERGETVAGPLKTTGAFPGMVVQMIRRR